ncbi:MAG: SGNH/GDSL hydrolase family protein [Actinomycetales bacterium]|nr:SGNH/GDSL hydrolase family protein [Candidatus Phosphoribacter baldrii]
MRGLGSLRCRGRVVSSAPSLVGVLRRSAVVGAIGALALGAGLIGACSAVPPSGGSTGTSAAATAIPSPSDPITHPAATADPSSTSGPSRPGSASGPARLLVFGDSISTSAFRSTPGNSHPERIGPGWPDRLARLTGPGLAVVNLASPGSWLCTENPVGPIPSLVSQVSTAVTKEAEGGYLLVLGGRNDLTHVTDTQLRQAVTDIAAAAAAHGMVAAFVTVLPVNDRTGYRALTEPQRRRFNSWLQATFPHLVVSADPVVDRDRDGQLDRAFDAGDGFHLNEAGSDALAAAAADLVRANGWPLG